MKHPIEHTHPSRCRLHSDRTAHWYCEPCRLPLCTSCKPYAEQLPLEVDCPFCGQAMRERSDEIDAATANRTAIRYAFQLPALGIAPLVALIAALGFHSLAGIFLVVPAGVLVLFLMIAFASRTGEGHARPPSLGTLFDIDHMEYCLRLLPFGLPFAVLLILATASGSMPLATAAWLLTAALMPAMLMATVIADSPGAAFDPASIERVIRVTGRPYANIALLLAGATLVIAATTIGTGGSTMAIQATLAFVATLLVLALCARLGMMMRSHRRVLEYPAGVAPIDRPRRPEASVYEPALLAADARTLLHEKKTRDARVLLGNALTRFPDDLQLNEQFDALVSSTARPKEIRNHLERRMHRLMRCGQVAAATELWQRNSPLLDNWVPRVSETRYRLALELDEMGEHQTAFRLLIGLPPEDRKFAHIAEAWMEAARILEQRLGDPGKAAELRRLVHERYPEQAAAWKQRWVQGGGSTLPDETSPAVSALG